MKRVEINHILFAEFIKVSKSLCLVTKSTGAVAGFVPNLQVAPCVLCFRAITAINRTPPIDVDDIFISRSTHPLQNPLQAPNSIQQMALRGGPEYNRTPS